MTTFTGMSLVVVNNQMYDYDSPVLQTTGRVEDETKVMG